MTTPQSQCTNLELSKKLRDLGYKQESLFYWQQKYQDMGDSSASYFELTQIKTKSVKGRRCISAPTVAEIAETMNVELTDANEDGSYTLKISSAIDFWCVTFGDSEIDITPQFENTGLADALAEMLIYLLENKLIEL